MDQDQKDSLPSCTVEDSTHVVYDLMDIIPMFMQLIPSTMQDRLSLEIR